MLASNVSAQFSYGDLGTVGEISIDDLMPDVTKFVGERLMLDCAITGSPVPSYVWYKDGQLLDQTDRRVVIKSIEWGNR